MNDKSYLLVFDFDGTAANTFEPNPRGIGVDKAYQFAVRDIFGQDGLDIYDDAGGLKNRAPEEIVVLILDADDKMLEQAEKCFDEKCKTLRRLVPEGKGAPLEWVASDKARLQKTIAEMLVLIKLSYLMDEIGSKFDDGGIWPRPCLGFLKFLRKIEELRQSGLDINLAIISSGHELFIKKTFKAWGFEAPKIILTDDDMRGRTYPEDFRQRVKPSPYLFDIIQAEWIGKGILFSDYARHIELMRQSRQRMIYFGDDDNKDGGLAQNAGILFGLFNQEQKVFDSLRSNYFVFNDWKEIVDFFGQDKVVERIKKGKPVTKIISLL